MIDVNSAACALRRSCSSRLTTAALALIVWGFLVACSSSVTQDNQGGIEARDSVQEGTTPEAPSASDEELMEELREHTSSWNEVLAPVVADYLDPNVDADAWVVEAGPLFSELEPKIRAMGDIAAQLSDQLVRRDLFEIIQNYQAKLAAFSALVNAVSAGDGDAERQAQIDLNEASQAGTQLAQEFMVNYGF